MDAVAEAIPHEIDSGVGMNALYMGFVASRLRNAERQLAVLPQPAAMVITILMSCTVQHQRLWI